MASAFPNQSSNDLFSFRQHIDTAVRNSKEGTLVLVDIENFKQVNYEFGTVCGDQTLLYLGQQLATHLAEAYDNAIRVLHYNCDVFLMFLPTRTTQEDAIELFAHVSEVIKNPISVENQHIILDFRMALTCASKIANSFDNLMEAVEYSIRLAKSDGERFVRAESAIPETFRSRGTFCQAFNDAIANNELRFVYQPKHDMSEDGKVVGCEALARWYDVDGNLYPLPVFLDAIFHNDKSQEFAKYTIRSAFGLLQDMRSKGLTLTRVSINMDVLQIADTAVFQYFLRMANNEPFLVRYVEIELTEDNLFSKHNNCLRNLHMLQRTGFAISIDDFGKGYSNLRTIIDIRPNTLKIDKGFIDFIGSCESTGKVLKAIVEMDLVSDDIVAEGVESIEQVEKLLAIGIKTAQGFYYNHPMQRDNFLELFEK